MNTYLLCIIGLLLLDFIIGNGVELLNLRCLSPVIPDEFKDWYDADKYAKSQDYTRTNTRFGLLQSSIMLPITLAFILLGGFAWVDATARSCGFGLIGTGLVFTGLIFVLSTLVHLPFDIYDTFVIEERYGFNRTTWKTFVLDRIKGIALGVLIGAPLMAGILWFFSRTGKAAWLYSWGVVTIVQFFLMYISPVVILPLFNKFTPLEDGELREAIEAYAREQNFLLKGIFKIDGSRRSSKSNAYFTGFGRWRRIALFDTLIDQHDTDELLGVLAHEVGHYKRGHIIKHLAMSVLSSGLMFYILSLFISRPGLYQAFGVSPQFGEQQMPIYAGLVFFGFLYAPISMLISIVANVLSQRHEYEADAYAAETTGRPEALISALKRLSVDNLSNLTPHPVKVFLEYSHPPVLQRIKALAGSDRE